MEKATLIVRQAKNKKFIAELKFASGKMMPFPQLSLKDTTLNGTEVEVEREKGQVIRVTAGDKVIFSPAAVPKSQPNVKGASKPKSFQKEERVTSHSPAQNISASGWQHDHLGYVRNPASAPYNFIPLNKVVVGINPTIPVFDKYDATRNTGWIELEIEAITPLFIRGTLRDEEVREGIQSKDKSDFFSPADQTRIPGSSLRGMTRNIIEMVSFGKFEFFEDRRLYYRGLADRSGLREDYQGRMSSYDSGNKRSIYKFSVGVLRKRATKERGLHFEIKSSGSNFQQILKAEAMEKVQAIGGKYTEFNFYKLEEGFLVISGNMPNKKRDWLIAYPTADAEVFPIPEEDVWNYNNDRTRDDRVSNLLEIARRGEEVPCFYVRWRDKGGKDRASFGHTGMFRLAYEKTIAEHVPIRDETKIDFAEAIFGNEKTHAGRVFFEDAFLTENQNDVQMGEQTPQILSSPKPTTFQHYLTQSSDEVRKLNHYNSNASVRGHKFYWHKSGEQWAESDQATITKHRSQYTTINPVKPGAKFRGRIRFENLSDTELGALLFSLNLPEGCCHKLGMGKPLGLGSIRITPKLYLSDRQTRYKDFLAEWDNELAESDKLQEKMQTFGKYILGELGENEKQTLWETERLRELLVMLQYELGKKLESNGQTRYMTIGGKNEFKNRPVLPNPSNLLPPEVLNFGDKE